MVTTFSGTVTQHEAALLGRLQMEAGVRLGAFAEDLGTHHRDTQEASYCLPALTSKSEIAKGHLRAPWSVVTGQKQRAPGFPIIANDL